MRTELTEMSSRQHGLVTRAQLVRVGLTQGAIRHLLESNALEVVHPSVYRVAGSPITGYQRLLAACFALGETGAASHRAAAHLWGLDGPFAGHLEVTAERGARTRPGGIVVHRSTDLTPEHTTVRHGVPVTRPARTLVDLGAVVSQKVLDRAVDDALAKRLVTFEGLLVVLGEVGRRGRRGVGKLRASLAERSGAPESVLEAELQRLIARSGLPEPEYQHEVRDRDGRFVARVDAAYADERIAIEADGASTRARREMLDYDDERQNDIVACGWTVLRFTWRQVVGEPESVVLGIWRILDAHVVRPRRAAVAS